MSEQRAPAAAGKSSMLPPMLCSADLHCLDADPAAWAWEVKWDGWRAQLHNASVRLWSRQGRSLTTAFPDVLAAAAAALADRDVVLDGELVVLGADGRPDFAALCGRGGRRAERVVRQATPAVLVAFDLLVLDGHDLRSSPWQQRRRLLEQLGLPTQAAAGAASLVCPTGLRRRRGVDPRDARARSRGCRGQEAQRPVHRRPKPGVGQGEARARQRPGHCALVQSLLTTAPPN